MLDIHHYIISGQTLWQYMYKGSNSAIWQSCGPC
jgi:hypothetical protein